MAGVAPTDRRSQLAQCAPAVVVAIAIGFFFAANGRWMNDNGFFSRPPPHDASWYRLESYRSSQVLQDAGFRAWVNAGRHLRGPHPPFLVMFTGLCLGVWGRPDAEPRDLFFVSAFFGALMAIATYRLARNFLSSWGAALCAFIA